MCIQISEMKMAILLLSNFYGLELWRFPQMPNRMLKTLSDPDYSEAPISPACFSSLETEVFSCKQREKLPMGK